MDILNKDLLFEIFKILPVKDYFNICLSCKYFNECIKSDLLWQYKYIMEECDFNIINKIGYFFEDYKLFHQLTKLKIKLKRYKDKSFSELENLNELNLTLNHMGEIPKELGCLLNLSNLYLSYNFIEKIPWQLNNLLNLKDLDLSHNRIKIPKELGNLLNLSYLNLSYNKIKEIPRELGNLQHLRILNLNQNYIKKIPKELSIIKISF